MREMYRSGDTVACATAFMGQVRGHSLAGACKRLRGSVEDLLFDKRI